MGLTEEQEVWSTGIMKTEVSPTCHPPQTLLSKPKTLLGSKGAEKKATVCLALTFTHDG